MELLLVEDNNRISEFVVKGLEESGFSVVLAENGYEKGSGIGLSIALRIFEKIISVTKSNLRQNEEQLSKYTYYD